MCASTSHNSRVILIVLDSVGCGALEDAASYGDIGANTLANIAKRSGGLIFPNLGRMGLGCITPIQGVPTEPHPTARYGMMNERSAGKDTTTGHWELMGLTLKEPFPVYPQGFDEGLMTAFSDATGYGFLGNYAASGTEIISDLGEEHMRTGKPIVYTSADSVFQIAAHEDVIPINDLYDMCAIARNQVLVGDRSVGRVIARPFVGSSLEGFVRTARRHDYSVTPSKKTALDLLEDAGVKTVGIGKIFDIFAGQGITESLVTASNDDGVATLVDQMMQDTNSFLFANLVDFDMSWGHRRDIAGYKTGLEKFDALLPGIVGAMREGDILIITADHGCDPTMPGSDHTREYVPVLLYGNNILSVDLGVRGTFADVGATVLDFYGVNRSLEARSLLG